MTLCFAYGSNMLAARLVARCASARVAGTAVVAGYDIAFDKIGQDGSGKATLVAGKAGVPGVLYDLAPGDLALLDEIEGVGRGYDRVAVAAGPAGDAFAYIAPARFRDAGLRPFDWYMDLVLAGARAHGLPAAWIARLQSVRVMPDPDPARPRRTEALALLAGAGACNRADAARYAGKPG